MSYGDTARFARDLDAYITRDDRPDGADFGEPVTCETRGCDATHPSDDYAREDGWTIVHDDDHDVVLCPACVRAAHAAASPGDAGDGVPW